jgi:hypothetical protein
MPQLLTSQRRFTASEPALSFPRLECLFTLLATGFFVKERMHSFYDRVNAWEIALYLTLTKFAGRRVPVRPRCHLPRAPFPAFLTLLHVDQNTSISTNEINLQFN